MCSPAPRRKVAAPARVERDSLAAWHCSARSQPGWGNSLGWALPGTASWIRKCLEVKSLPPPSVAGGCVPSGCWMSQCLSSAQESAMILFLQIQKSPLTFGLRSALLLLDFHTGPSTIKPIPVHPTQPPPQILQAPQSYLKGKKKGPVRWSGWRRGGGKIYKWMEVRMEQFVG